MCNSRILSHSVIMKCGICNTKYHSKCINFNHNDVTYLSGLSYCWICMQCNSDILPFNNLESDDMFIEALYELTSDGSIDLSKIKDLIFNPFTLNENNNVPLFETDPDINFYNQIGATMSSCSEFVFEDELKNKHI